MLSGHDHDRARKILRWPLREVLVAYVAREREVALAQYRHEEILYRLIAPYSKNVTPPGLPGILRPPDGSA